MTEKVIRELHKKRLKEYEDAVSKACAVCNETIENARQTFLDVKRQARKTRDEEIARLRKE